MFSRERRASKQASAQPARRPAAPVANSPAAAPKRSRQVCPCGGGCPRCGQKSKHSAREDRSRATAQMKSAILSTRAGDQRERQAHQMAEQITQAAPYSSGTTRALGMDHDGTAHSSCAGSCRTGQMLRPSPSAIQPDHAVHPSVRRTLSSPGRPLNTSTRAFFESRFGHDFSHVRVHTDAAAAESSRAVSALAYTLGSHIVFSGGRFAPQTLDGRKLLAHELTHTLQPQDGQILRCPDAASTAEYDKITSDIKGSAIYQGLPEGDRQNTDDIIIAAKPTDKCLYYAEHLKKLFETHDAPPVDIEAKTVAASEITVHQEEKHLQTKEGITHKDAEEKITAAHQARFIKRPGWQGTMYYVDNSNPNDIAVKIKIHLYRSGNATDAQIAQVKSLEDATEKAASTKGYSVDIEYVDKNWPDGHTPDDVFEVGVNLGEWETSGNFTPENPHAIAHEVHHLLGLPDRYNYIESHTGNPALKMSARLYWFKEQVRRDIHEPPDKDRDKSIMSNHYNKPYDDDICKVAGLDVASCMAARQAAGGVNPPGAQSSEVTVLFQAGGGYSRSGIHNTWQARYYMGGELRNPVLGLFNPTLGIGLTVVGNPLDAGVKPELSHIDPALITSVLAGLRVGDRTGPYLSAQGGPSLVVGDSVKLGAEAAVAAGYRWHWFDVSVRAGYLYDPSRASDDQNVFSATVNVGIPLR